MESLLNIKVWFGVLFVAKKKKKKVWTWHFCSPCVASICSALPGSRANAMERKGDFNSSSVWVALQ